MNLVPVVCPSCGRTFSTYDKVTGKNNPEPGDFFSCPACKVLCIFDIILRTATDEEIKDAMSNTRFAKHANSEYN
jgi:hypothetical protein